MKFPMFIAGFFIVCLVLAGAGCKIGKRGTAVVPAPQPSTDSVGADKADKKEIVAKINTGAEETKDKTVTATKVKTEEKTTMSSGSAGVKKSVTGQTGATPMATGDLNTVFKQKQTICDTAQEKALISSESYYQQVYAAADANKATCDAGCSAPGTNWAVCKQACIDKWAADNEAVNARKNEIAAEYDNCMSVVWSWYNAEKIKLNQ